MSNTSQQQPSIGRIVHYYHASSQQVPTAAIVLDVNSDGSVNLREFDSATMAMDVTYNDTPVAGPRWTHAAA